MVAEGVVTRGVWAPEECGHKRGVVAKRGVGVGTRGVWLQRGVWSPEGCGHQRGVVTRGVWSPEECGCKEGCGYQRWVSQSLLADESLGPVSVRKYQEVGAMYLTRHGQHSALLIPKAYLICWEVVTR